ncbi:MAG TPA: hypothetical protein VED40_00275 [Azospirillaceae bacterium]|nr:hypothetical protein [Azospirillaceae bacterium]
MSLIEKVPAPVLTAALSFGAEATPVTGMAGMVPVPLKPSLEMLTAGARAGGVSVETVWSIYRAMLREAQ